MLGIIIAIIKVAIVLGLIIFMHELGHFLVAKKCGIRVNQFSMGFGPCIWSKEKNGTKYALRAFPLGGFVSMEGEEERSESKDAFNNKSIGKRAAVLVAGALVNILFAFIIYFIFTSVTGYYKATIKTNQVDQLEQRYGAEVVGVLPGDKIIKINDKKTSNMNGLEKILSKNGDKPVKAIIIRDNREIEKEIIPKALKTKSVGIILRINKRRKDCDRSDRFKECCGTIWA